MSLGKTIHFFLVLAFASPVWSQVLSENQTVRPAPKWIGKAEVGAGFALWNERLAVRRGNTQAQGTSNYAGLFVLWDHNWRNRTWMLEYGAGLGAGKASAGRFGTIAFADAVDRPWTAAQGHARVYMRASLDFAVGLGMSARYRLVDWTPADSLLQVQGLPDLGLSPQVLLKLQIGRRWVLGQTLTSISSQGESAWQWSAQWRY